MTTPKERIAALRSLMKQHQLAAYIVPGTDPHASEYMADHWKETTWLSGFKGETGTVLVTLGEAFLWTDSRYYLQAEKELAGTGVTLMRESDIDTPSIPQWLCLNLRQGDTVGLNPEMFSVKAYAAWEAELAEAGLRLHSIDFIRQLWTEDRPAIPQVPLYEYKEQYAGESTESKLSRLRAELARRKADTMVISALDEIAWLLNIRGLDVDFNPVVISYVLVEKEACTLFVAPEKLTPEALRYLIGHHIAVQDYENIFAALRLLPHDSVVLFDGARLNRALYEAIPTECRKLDVQSPVLVMKSRKNPVELEGERKAMRQDAVALTRFFKWLEEDAFANGATPTEYDLMEKLHSFRMMGENFVVESFGTIAGYQGNGAIVHYEATPADCAVVRPEGMLLLDSGGQYLDGTTDITRTVWLGGAIPEQAKLDYTYVLKGHIALGDIRWPRGTRGNQLDALAKQYMWQAGITYGHGTGHGVGHFLGCHEGPQNVRTDNNPTVLQPGNICSDEPGIYRTGKWGVRIENLVAVTEAPLTDARTTDDNWLCWETLTLCYYDTTLIEMSLLTEHERAWLNAYHRRVADEVCPLLRADEADWLRNKCRPV
ncbi:MAG: aminopeptidase P family N-terminal domain-containing protein [Paludibacteraceae bacterium]|nr:aminopeptidase P family N-terminal domain-containing protein [Paludibacteraceae bacterium]